MKQRQYDVILLLGLQLNDDGTGRSEMTDRSRKAAELWHQGVAPVIIACGGATGATERTEAEVMREELISFGVDAKKIVCEDKSRVTIENLQNARKLLGSGRRRAALVTSDYHCHRAALIARLNGFHVKAFGAPTEEGESKRMKKQLEYVYTCEYLLSQVGLNLSSWRLMKGLVGKINELREESMKNT